MARLGKSNVLLEPLSEYLGDDFVLESALVITVDGGTEGQNAHTDTEARQETFLEEWMKQHNYQESKILLRRTQKTNGSYHIYSSDVFVSNPRICSQISMPFSTMAMVEVKI